MSPRAPHEGVRVDAPREVVPLGQRSRASLRVEGLCFARAGEVVLDDVNFTLEEGRLLAIVGPSGAGKSTLLADAFCSTTSIGSGSHQSSAASG